MTTQADGRPDDTQGLFGLGALHRINNQNVAGLRDRDQAASRCWACIANLSPEIPTILKRRTKFKFQLRSFEVIDVGHFRRIDLEILE